MKTKFIIIRHGESEGNVSSCFAGSLDVPLTELGKKQGACTGEVLKNEKIDCFYSSALSRAYETALLIARHHNKSVIKNKELNEIFGGKWESNSYTLIKEKFSESYILWETNIGLCVCDGGESVIEVSERVFSAFEEMGKKHSGETVCVTFHALALRAFLMKALQVPPEKLQTDILWASNASITYMEYEDGIFTLLDYGKDEHLEKEGLKSLLRVRA